MPATKKSFSVKSGLDANANSISNLGASSSSLALSGGHSVVLTTGGATTLTLPTSGTLLYDGGALGTPASGTLTNCTFPTFNQNTTGYASNLAGGNNTTLLGALPYQSNTNTTSLLSPNTTSTKKFLRMTGTGTNGAAPAWDTLVASDVPTLNQNTTGSAGSVTNALTISSPLSGTSYNGSAAVSIGLAASYGDTQNPYASKTANYVLAAPNGSAGVPTFRALVAADIPTLNQNTTGTAGSTTTVTTGGSVTTTVLTTGAAATAGTITGNWSLSASSKLSATYADLAENYTSDQQYDYGIVLMIGGDEEVTIAAEDTQRLAGVVSQNPAYLMNSACEGKHVVAIALQGRTPVRVIGKVNKGDFLVSAGDGYAKSTDNPRIGSIIGKSLESFDGQYGMVEAMVGRL